MSFFYKIYHALSWYPWMEDVIRAVLNGDIKNRLPMQKGNGKELSVILNGPSLNHSLQYLEREKTDIMMVNYAAETDLYHKLNPEYVCFADPVLFKPCVRNYNMFRKIEKINKHTLIFYPGVYKENMFMKNKNARKVFSTNRLLDVDLFSYRLLEKNLMAPYFINVGIMALYVGIQLGYKKIWLHGADMTMLRQVSVTENREIEIGDTHYYGEQKVNVTRLSRGTAAQDMKHVTQCFYEAFAQFKLLEKYAAARNVKIINMSDDTLIDCFERFRYREKYTEKEI